MSPEPLRTLHEKDKSRLMWKQPGTSARKKVLFICSFNSTRSQMAEGFLNSYYGDRYQAFSAGVKPGKIHPLAVDVMAEIGIDISKQRSKGIEDVLDEYFDVVVTVCDCAREECPIYPGGTELWHHGFEDPSAIDGTPEERVDAFRRVRDEISTWIKERFGEER
ncbi:MAG TPA: arsenate reductase ArsC [Methanomassiliicoccales archaeon]|nr:arsenate reductase ArsC [Methanomassiliicoccales archaeon]